ncbi:MAG: ABC transporter permease subunit [Spirochaetia bacterium]|jgi:ABC-type nitrate/sulfonate/bicarbonate transport system permease component|nr:ABC transporter permease subunit [Spirochaetia bacterium]
MKRYTIKEISIGFVMFLILWIALALGVNKPILPSPLSVLPVFGKLIIGELGIHFLVSTIRVITAILAAVIAAVPIGLILGQMKALNRFFSPLISVLYAIPKIVLLPVVYVLFGISNFSKIFLISLIIFFQILVVVRDESAGLPEALINSVKSLGAGRLALLRFVYFPASIPAILTAVRVSIGTSLAVLFIAEQSLTEYGLGYFIIVRAYQALRYKEMYAGILAISLLGFLLYYLIDILEWKVSRHR